MELFVLFIILFLVYGAGWIWQTVTDIVRDVRRQNWDNRVFGQVASARSVRRNLGEEDLADVRRAFAAVAERRGGRIQEHALFESPRVSFVHQTSRVLLSLYETRKRPARFYTQMTFTLPTGWTRRLELLPEHSRVSDTRYLNVGDLQVGDAEFDERHLIKTDDPDFARAFLDSATRQRVERLRAVGGEEKLLLSVNPSRMMIRKRRVLSRADELDEFVDLGCSLFDRLFLFWQQESGIEILDESTAEQAPAVCQVCGAPLDPAGVVYCRGCRTPHHLECWNYNQGCSTFACGEKKFVRKY